MSPRNRARIYEDLKDRRRQGQLSSASPPKSLSAELPNFGSVDKISELLERGDLEGVLAAIGLDHGALVEGLSRMLEVRTLADRVFGDEGKAREWLLRPNRSMSGQRPLDLMQDNLGAAVVRDTLERIDHGIFA